MLRVEHDCDINIKQEEIFYLPNGGFWHRLWLVVRQIFMASKKSPSARRYLRTHSSIIYEKRRHLRNFTDIIHPFSLFRYWWDALMILMMTALIFTIPHQAAFDMYRSDFHYWTIVKNSCLLLCCLDVIVNLRTGYFDDRFRHVEMNSRLIRVRYARKGTLVADLLGSFPTDLFFLGSWDDLVVARELSTLIYVFRMFSANAYVVRILQIYRLDEAKFRLLYTLAWLLATIHWFTCLTWIVPVATTSLGLPERPRNNDSWTNEVWTSEPRSRYWPCWRRSVAVLTRSGFFSEEPSALDEQYLGIAIELFGTFVFCMMIAQVMRYFKGSSNSKLEYEAIVAQLKQYMRHRQLPRSLQQRLLAYYEFRYQHRYFREMEILSSLSSHMLQEIGMHSCRKLVENVTFFNNLPISLLTRIVVLLKSEIFLTNDVIVRAKQSGDCMYFIATGTVAIYTASGKEVCHLEDGAHFGEIALVMPDERRVASVVAVELCELYRLERADFARTIHPYPMLWERIKKIAIERHEKTTIINER